MFAPGFVAWIAGFVGGLASHFSWIVITPVTAVDSMLIASVVYTALALKRKARPIPA